jgi:hypothetical protein
MGGCDVLGMMRPNLARPGQRAGVALRFIAPNERRAQPRVGHAWRESPTYTVVLTFLCYQRLQCECRDRIRSGLRQYPLVNFCQQGNFSNVAMQYKSSLSANTSHDVEMYSF